MHQPEGRSAVLLVFCTVVLYSRPQEIRQSAILITLSILIGFVFLSRRPPVILDRVALLGIGFIAAVFFVSLNHFSTPGAAIAAATFGVPFFAAILGSQILSPPRLLRTVDAALCVLILASLGAVFLFPQVGITPVGDTEGAWRGVFVHRNTFGYVLTLATCSTAARWFGDRSLDALRLTVRLGLLTWLLYECGSYSAILLSVSALFAAIVIRKRNATDTSTRLNWIVSCLLLLLLCAPFWLGTIESVVARLGKQDSLEGRTEIWAISASMIEKQPFLGYGRSQLLEPNNPVSRAMAEELGFSVRSIHNGFIGLVLECGVLVALLGIAFWCVAAWRSANTVSANRTGAAIFLLLALAVSSIGNLFETRLFAELGWFVTCLAAFASMHNRAQGPLTQHGPAHTPFDRGRPVR